MRPRTNGNGHLSGQPASIGRAIRGELPPEAGERWLLLEAACDAELKTSHPMLGMKRHALQLVAGTMSGLDGGQLELAIKMRCVAAQSEGTSATALFRSTSVTRSDSFRYLAKGELHVGGSSGIVVLKIHDLSWIARKYPDPDKRILTVAAVVDKRFWRTPAHGLSAPWLTRDDAEVFLHTEWRADRETGSAA